MPFILQTPSTCAANVAAALFAAKTHILCPRGNGSQGRQLAVMGSGVGGRRPDGTRGDRLPALAKERLRLAVLWVSREGDELAVEVDS
jgi:hypothetical protein